MEQSDLWVAFWVVLGGCGLALLVELLTVLVPRAMDRLQGWVTPAGSRRVAALSAALLVAAAVAMGELSRLVDESLVPGSTGGANTAAVRDVLGIGALAHTGSWAIWDGLAVGTRQQVAWWLLVHSLLSVVVAVAGVRAALRHLGASGLVSALLRLLVPVSVVQSLLVGITAVLLHTGRTTPWLAWPVAVVATAGTALLLAVVVATAVVPSLRDPFWKGDVWLTARAVKYQRFSVVPVLFLASLSVLPGLNILDQIPDVMRGWADQWPGRGLRHLVVALVATWLTAVLISGLGASRSARAARTRGAGGQPPAGSPQRRLFLLGPLVVVLSGVLVAATTGRDNLDASLLAAFVAVPVVLLLASCRLLAWPGLWVETASVDLPLVERVTQVGKALPSALLAVVGIGMVRSFTAPFADGPGDDRWLYWREAVLLLLGVALLASAPFLGAAVTACRTAAAAGYDGVARLLGLGGFGSTPRRVLLGLTGLVPLLLLTLLPRTFTPWLGPMGTALAGLAGWIAFLGSLVLYYQDRRTLEVFRLFQLRANPLLTLLVAVPVVVTLFPNDPGLHAVRTTHAPSAMRQVDVEGALAHWESTAGCGTPAPGGDGRVTYRPMLLLAASGGGIRAAYWTGSVLEALDASSCSASATLLSSGVSGGAVGLALARQASVDHHSASAALATMAEPDALAAGLSGTLVGDLFAGTTGVRPPALDVGDGPRAWHDRAGLMELAWERAEPGLRRPWDGEVRGPGGALVLNSTAVQQGCRVLVSQVRFHGVDPRAALGSTNCGTRSGLPAGALDLAQLYGDCLPGIRWSTAAMLAARFPTVTPAGRIPLRGETCTKDGAYPDLQLVDGGYAESSGVLTLLDVAPELMDQVRGRNARVLAAGTGELIVPVGAYLEDEILSDVTRRDPKQSPEALVPLAGKKAKGVQSSTRSWMQRLAAALADPCPTVRSSGDACRRAVAAVHGVVPDGMALVAVSTEPAVQAPLGWTLSRDSRTRLTRAVRTQACTRVTASDRYVGLEALLRLLNRGIPSSLCT